MGDFLRLLLDSIQFLWPFRIVRQWERANYYVFGKYWKSVGPGVYPVLPFFMDVMTASAVPAIVNTPRLDITIQDGTVLSFSVSGTCQIVDMNLAINSIDSYTETTQELLAAVLADKLADVDVARLEPEKRRRLLADLRGWANAEARTFGIGIEKVRFTSFVLRPKTFRLLNDTYKDSGGW